MHGVSPVDEKRPGFVNGTNPEARVPSIPRIEMVGTSGVAKADGRGSTGDASREVAEAGPGVENGTCRGAVSLRRS